MPPSLPPSPTQAHPRFALVSRLILSLFYLLRCFFKTNRNLQASGMIYRLIRDLGGRCSKIWRAHFPLLILGAGKWRVSPR